MPSRRSSVRRMTSVLEPLPADPHGPQWSPPFLSSVVPRRFRSTRPRSFGSIDSLDSTPASPTPTGCPSRKHRDVLLAKLAGSRETVKRLLHLRTSANPAASSQPQSPRAPRSTRPRPTSEIVVSGRRDAPMDANLVRRRSTSPSDCSTATVRRPGSRVRSSSDESLEVTPLEFPGLRHEKVVATGNGISVSLALAEPVLFLPGYDHNDPSTKKSAILRGHLRIKTTKSVKIKKISVCFRGHAQTEWPDGIPPRKVSFHDKKDLVTHGLLYFNNGEPSLVSNDYGAHYYKLAHAPPQSTTREVKGSGVTTTTRELLKNGTATSVTRDMSREVKRLSWQSGHSRSLSRHERSPGPARNYHIFPPGDYIYAFEFPIDGSLPETIKSEMGFVRYDLEAIVERAGAFRPNLLGSTEVEVIRTPAEGSLEQVEPIAISRNWEDQLHYEIVILGKSFPLGSQIPIAFKLTPLAKVECHRIKVYVTENIQHWTQDRSVHRFLPPKKILLFEKRADSPSVSTYPGSTMRVTAGGGIERSRQEAAARGEEQVDRHATSLLGNLSNDASVGPTEMEFNVQLPSCHSMKGRDAAHRLHFDTTYENIQINHWIKIVMRLSKTDEKDPNKRRHFEITIDSPFHILSCKATQNNIYLPAYDDPSTEPGHTKDPRECGCPRPPSRRRTPGSQQPGSEDAGGPRGPPRSFTSGSGGLAQPEQAHVAPEPNERVMRPIHLLRAPSFAPPSFDEIEPPPPLITPPPEYTSVVGDVAREAVLADYFSRLSYYEEHEEDGRGLGRVDVPLTPGGRVHRSMDVPRDWVRLGESTV